MLKFRRSGTSNTATVMMNDDTSSSDGRGRGQEAHTKAGSLMLEMVAMSKDDIKKPEFWKAVLAELVGTTLLILFGCGSWIEADIDEHPLTVRIALTFGLCYATLLYALRDISGGHVNPTVTVAMAVTRRISLARGACYCLAQFIGASIGAGLLYGFTPKEYRTKLGSNYTAMMITAEQGFGIEAFISFFYVFVVCSSYGKVDKTECVVHKLFTPFIIGFAAIVVHLYAIPHTGASLNPARSFGPALVTGIWSNHWIYWFGPLIGGTLGGVLYQTAFSHKASLHHLHTCMVTHENDSDDGKEAKKPYVRFTSPNIETATAEEAATNQKSAGNQAALKVKGDLIDDDDDDGTLSEDETDDDDIVPRIVNNEHYIANINHVSAVPVLRRESATPLSESESELTHVSPINTMSEYEQQNPYHAVVSIEEEDQLENAMSFDKTHVDIDHPPELSNRPTGTLDDIKVVYDHLNDDENVEDKFIKDKNDVEPKADDEEGKVGYEHPKTANPTPAPETDFDDDPIVAQQRRVMESKFPTSKEEESNSEVERHKQENAIARLGQNKGNDKGVQIPYDEDDPEGSHV